ncbi:MAG: hypothetical protein RQ760_16740, partial [Sedimentisphaerales bacterium]|nr:hypothetical protein [Sedimentisphaerales bacterium]
PHKMCPGLLVGDEGDLHRYRHPVGDAFGTVDPGNPSLPQVPDVPVGPKQTVNTALQIGHVGCPGFGFCFG